MPGLTLSHVSERVPGMIGIPHDMSIIKNTHYWINDSMRLMDNYMNTKQMTR